MASLDSALEAIDDWPVSVAAAAIVDASGVRAIRGQVDTPLPLASVTKPLAVLAMLVAVEEGALDFDDPADESLLPGATFRHLLAHASGIAPERPLRSFAPGRRRVYSNVGIELAGSLTSIAVEMPFTDYFRQALVEPLALQATTLEGSPARDAVASVADLARVMLEVFAPSRLLHPSTIADATSVQYPGLRGVLPGFGSQNPNDWGLGFEIRGSKEPHWTGTTNSPATFGHFGQSGTMFWIDPVAQLGLVALTDRSFGPWAADAWPRLSDAVLAAA
jgi:CubicO group peptidase (beta-lactamase class C family)